MTRANILTFNGVQFVYSGNIFLTKSSARNKAAEFRASKKFNARVVPMRQNKRTFYLVYYAPRKS